MRRRDETNSSFASNSGIAESRRRERLKMSPPAVGKGRKGKKRGRIEIIPENAEYEEHLPSIGDETPSDDTGEQEEISERKKKKANTTSIPDASSKQKSEQTEVNVNPYAPKERKKTSASWKYLDTFVENGQKYARCKLCKTVMKRNRTASTTQLNRHVNKCKVEHGITRQTQLKFTKDGNTSEVKLEPFVYDHAEMRKTVAHYILINELPFMHVESFMFNEVMKKATPLWQKISGATVKADCMATYESEKNKLKEVFKSVKKINITTDMWTSSNQKLGYMVVTSHWIDAEWKLNMRVLNFCNVPPPHSGYVIAEALSRCLNEWGIDEKIGTIVVDNAKANDVALRNLKDTFSIRNPLPVEGKLFHARCCAHVLNLCVQDGLRPIEPIVDRIRDGVKYVAASEGRRNKFAEISTQLHLKSRKLILDVSTRWNSTYNMLQCAIGFKQVFKQYGASDVGFQNYVPEKEDWEKVEWVCSILGAFNEVTKIVSGTHYPTSNLFLSEIKMVKHILDKRATDPNLHIREMTEAMKEKFDKYWGESNLVMSIGAVLDPRFKMKLPTFCFPTLYPKEGESDRNLTYLSNVLNDLYQEYVNEDKVSKKKEIGQTSGISSCDYDFVMDTSETPQGLNDYESFIRDSGAIQEPLKSELDDYLGEKIVFSSSKSFDVLSWWKGNAAKYPILSNMARDILSIPMNTVASESTFSAGGRVIEPHRSCLKPQTVEMLLCGADWARELYGLKKTNHINQDTSKDIEIDLYSSTVTS